MALIIAMVLSFAAISMRFNHAFQNTVRQGSCHDFNRRFRSSLRALKGMFGVDVLVHHPIE
jgi:hypothetical protein